MACASGCTGACTATCQNSCSIQCTGGCQANGCTSCQGCRGGCRDTGGCGGDCQGTCSVTCGNAGCSGTCKGGCTGCSGCSGGCTGTCAAKCTGGAQDTKAADLALTTKMERDNIKAISDFINVEAKRRGKTPTSVTFTVGNQITKANIDTVIANLKKAGKTAAYSATQGSQALKKLGQDLVTKALDAWDDTVSLS